MEESGSVELCRVEQIGRYAREEADEEQHVEGAGRSGHGQDDPGLCVQQAEPFHQDELRNDDGGHRYEQGGDDHPVQELSSREFVAGQDVSAQGRLEQFDDGGYDRVQNRVEEVPGEPCVHPRPAEVVEVPLIGHEAGAAGEESRLCLERSRDDPEERIDPDEAHHDQQGQGDEVGTRGP
nr:hypothetical protein [Streptomyces phaeochromogenes]